MSSDMECPKCHGDIFNPCDPGCCQAGYCADCDIVYSLKVMDESAALHYKILACSGCGEASGDEHLCGKHNAEALAVKQPGAKGGPVREMWWEADDFHVVFEDGSKTVYKGARLVGVKS